METIETWLDTIPEKIKYNYDAKIKKGERNRGRTHKINNVV